ncbi:TonB-dependent receptor [Hyphomicrobium sp.]|uniref:TonB-dependent receptor n=1 Tax=Hyphomicrobium sp. TaxID=82 RepID=UPI002C93D8A5|nr:TonB-dependent receptor [Hyphomicrobium sp.]HRN87170.1 TonB-dependent receptor [Hyphomicrobium sp.]HRQ25770.1 TonB-dependent receptor [Hyphomicrobium sp.]
MSVAKLSLSALIVFAIVGGPHRGHAQDAASSSDDEIIELPGVIVEAPARRNVKKISLRKGTQRSGVAADASSDAALDQQVVEGEKIVRTIRDTTTSIGVVTGRDINERQIRDLDEAIEQTANVITSKDPNAGFVVRGLNSEGQTGLQHISAVPLVGVAIDGVTQNPDAVRRGARALWDVEQVEVMRGPQSTLQGRNSIGGHVNVKTNDPTYKLGAIVEGTVGTNDLKAGGFVLNSPIVAGQSAFRISGYKTERERDIRYADPQNAAMGVDGYETLRAKLLIEPDSLPGFSALFTVAHTEDTPGSAFVSGPNFLKRELNNSAAFTDFREGSVNNYASDLSYEFMPGLTVRSVTAYADTESLIKTASGAQLIRNGDTTSGKDFTQDVRLEIDNRGNGLSGVLGLFYGYFERDVFTNTTLHVPFLAGVPGLGQFAPILPDTIIPYLSGTTVSETVSMAAYADLRYRWDRWVFIGGGRILRDEVDTRENTTTLDPERYIRTLLGDPRSPYTNIVQGTEASFNEFLPKIGVTYDLTDNQTVGLTYNKGYRAGFQQVSRLPIGDNVSTVDPEYIDAYELSYRSNWLNKTLDFNANAFYYEYKDQQVVVLDDTYSVAEIFNAGSSHAYGAELEARWRPIPPLQIFASVGLLKTEYDDIEVRNIDHSGNKYPEAPAYTLAAGAMYRSPMGWFLGANVRHTDGYYSYGDIANIPERYVDSYTVVDARAGWEWEHYTLTVFAKNLFDEKYLTSVDTRDSPPLAPAYGFIGDERTVGMTLTGRF